MLRKSIIILSITALCQALLTGPLPDYSADMDFFCYYGEFGPTEVWQAQYFDLFILEPDRISASQIQDIRNGFDDVPGTADDVLVFGYVSVGETYYNDEVGDGTGPVYFNGTDTIYQNSGYASYFLDDYDQNGEPDMNGIWNSYYVNAGDPNWWEFNAARLDNTLLEKNCDGLFLDTIGNPFPASWGGSYGWTAGGMADYVAYLRMTYPEKYLFANNPSLYLHPALPAYPYRDIIRSSINAYMYEGYYLTWSWDLAEGYVSPWFESARDTWAPIINAEAAMDDGFTVVALDYLGVDQADFATLLANQIQFTEADQSWLTAVSSVWLNEIRYDTYHNHPIDNNTPTWTGLPGVLYYDWDGVDMTLYWNAAVDQTPPNEYHLYFDALLPDFSDSNNFETISPSASDLFDWEYSITNLSLDTEYYVSLRASDATPDTHLDQNRRIFTVSTDPNNTFDMMVDGLFNDWSTIENIDNEGEQSELTGDAPIAACDLLDLWVTVEGENLYLSCSYGEPPEFGSYYYHLFLDTDEDPATGFHSGGSYLGAEFMVENQSIYRYTGSDDSWSWDWAGELNIALGSVEAARFEASIPLDLLEVQGFTLSLLFNVNDNADLGPDDYLEQSYEYTFTPASISDVTIPKTLILSAYPNPFNSSITFKLSDFSGMGTDGQIQIYDLQGRFVQQLDMVSNQAAEIAWDGLDVDQNSIESGIYIYRMIIRQDEIGQKFSSGKILALK